MNGKKTPQPVETIRKSLGETFLPQEVVDQVDNLFIVREFEGPTVEKRLSIRRPLFERALRHAILQRLNPEGPKPMQRAASATGSISLVRRTA